MSGGTIAGAGLSLGSTLANSLAQSKMDAARSAVMSQQNAAQAALDSQIQAKNTDALGGYADFTNGTANQKANLASLYSSGTIGSPTNSAPNVMPTSRNGAVAANAAAQVGQKAAYATQQGNALAAVQAPGMALTQANIQRARDASAVAQLDNFKSGTAATLPMQLDAANQTGTGLKTLGDILRGGAAIGYGQGAPGTAAWLGNGGPMNAYATLTGNSNLIGNVFPSF